MTTFTEREPLAPTSVNERTLAAQTVTEGGKPPETTFTPVTPASVALTEADGPDTQTITERSLSATVVTEQDKPDSQDVDKCTFTPITTSARTRFAPLLITTPVATPEYTTCVVTWEVSRPSYHRVRYKVSGGSWQYTSWSATATEAASVTITGLTNGTEYIYDIQSCVSGDGTRAFPFYLGNDTQTFTTDVLPVVSGISDAPDTTSCEVSWTSDIPAYHRVRYREVGGSWVYSSWTGTLGTSASVTISGLTPAHTEHEYQVQSGLNGDGTAACSWSPADPNNFYTLCITPFVFHTFGVGLYYSGDIPYFRFTWETDADQPKTEMLVKYKRDSDISYYYAWWSDASPSATSFQMDSECPGRGDYVFEVKNRDACGNQEGSGEGSFSVEYNALEDEYEIHEVNVPWAG